MKTKAFYILSLLFIALGAYLRFHGYIDRAPFDWDQTRDYSVVSGIVSGHPTLLGPVAKGDGGFHLAPLYYYLLVPGYLISHHSPVSLPATSIAIDLLSILAVALLASKLWGRKISLFMIAMWSFSWLMVDGSRVSWNVALLPLWSLLSLVIFTKKTKLSSLYIGLLAGMSWHVHASLIPLGGIFVFLELVQNKFEPKRILHTIFGYLIAISPLLLFDLRHSWFNLLTMRDYFVSQELVASPDITFVIKDVLSKFSFVITRAFIGEGIRSFVIGLILLCLPIATIFSRKLVDKIAGLSVILILALNIYLRDLGFPEYYLLGAYVPFLYSLASLIFRTKLGVFVASSVVILSLFFNLRAYDTTIPPYGLGVKSRIAEHAAQSGSAIDLRTEFSYRREGGIRELVLEHDTTIDELSPIKILVTDDLEGLKYINGDPATEIYHEGGIRVLMYKVQ